MVKTRRKGSRECSYEDKGGGKKKLTGALLSSRRKEEEKNRKNVRFNLGDSQGEKGGVYHRHNSVHWGSGKGVWGQRVGGDVSTDETLIVEGQTKREWKKKKGLISSSDYTGKK